MKRVGVGFLFVVIGLGCLYAQALVSANSESHWAGITFLQEIGDITETAVNDHHYCDYKKIQLATLDHPAYGELAPHLKDLSTTPTNQDVCVINNGQGRFASAYTGSWSIPRHESTHFSPGSLTSGFVKWQSMRGTTNWYDPAPGGGKVLELYRKSPYDKNYEITVHHNLRSWGRLEADNTNVLWAGDPNTIATRADDKLTNQGGKSFFASLHRFSNNGRYLVARSGDGIVKIDLADLSRTLVIKVSIANGAKPHDLAISNDGKYVTYTNYKNDLEIIDTSSCELTEKSGEWQRRYLSQHTPQELYKGCKTVRDLKPQIQNLFTVNAQIQRLYFNDTGSELMFSLKSDTYTAENPVHDYSWKEYKLTASEYVPSAAGYLAMGDSFTSGEGDTIGGEWYEPGTDEQGDRNTFAGRNLCHLSRRSYPYLIALDLGLLQSNLASPPSDGLFHSVACSGAKIHNIIGGQEGEKHDSGGESDFSSTDNQYRYDEISYILDQWHPGFTAQINSLNDTHLESKSSRNFAPEIITLGIGGNDAGFGDFLAACVLPNTCDFAVNDSQKATRLGVRIAQQKTHLTNVFKQLRKESPEARIYVHGYPEFVRPSAGNCANNVRLDAKERKLAAGATRYMNQVVEAAAKQAGVVYLDISDIFVGGRLCDEEGPNYVNGVTKGNDAELLKLRIIGSESFHPTPEGFKQYKSSLFSLSSTFTKQNPNPQNDVQYPVPDQSLFGTNAVQIINDMNNSYNSGNQPHSKQGNMVTQRSADGKQLHIKQSGFYPGSSVQIEAHSSPINLGVFSVNDFGELQALIDLPKLSPGYHELHLTGFDSFGQAVDIYQSFFVAFNSSDFDGDGVADNQDSCPTLTNAGNDADSDGTDDACDNQTSATTNNKEAIKQEGSTSVVQRVIEQFVRSTVNTPNQPNNSSSESIASNANTSLTEPSANNEVLSHQTPVNQLNQTQVGVQWWLIAIGLSIISVMVYIFGKLNYAKN